MVHTGKWKIYDVKQKHPTNANYELVVNTSNDMFDENYYRLTILGRIITHFLSFLLLSVFKSALSFYQNRSRGGLCGIGMGDFGKY